MPEISVVVPVYNCGPCLVVLHERLNTTLAALGVDYELVLIDDRSTDDSWAQLRELAARDPKIRAWRLSRNFGQHAAITAGLAHSSGNWIVVMDCDLQDPPELIDRLYGRAREGYDIVFGRRIARRHSWPRVAAAKIYSKVLSVFFGTDVEGQFGAYSIISRKVADAFLQIRDKDRQYLQVLFWLGFEHSTIDFEHEARYAGESSYKFGRLLRHAFEGIFFQTTTLLRWIVYLGFVVAVVGLILAVIVTYLHFTQSPPEGWASLAVLVLVIGGFIIISTGVTGLYIGMIFKQVKDRPLFVVDEAAHDRVPNEEPR